MTSIAVVGTGYVGLSSGACFAHLGHQVTCLDIDEVKVQKLSNGIIPIVEDQLQELVAEGLSTSRLTFTTDYETAISTAEVVFLCVPTPENEDGTADLTYLQAAAHSMSKWLKSGAIVVNKSTVPVGSTRVVEKVLARSDISVVSNPEFLREGTAIRDFLEPDRIVVGSENREAAMKVAELYSSLQAQVLVTDPASAETIKYAANAFLATKISYINAVAAICEGVGADIGDVVLGLGYDHRIGHEFMNPGPGWGGSCFPKDTKALVKIAEAAGYEFGLLKGVIEVNEQQLERTANKIAAAAEGGEVAIWGLTFKAGTDDLRDSPSIEIAKKLLARGVRIRAYDPTVSVVPASIEGVTLSDSPLVAATGAHVVALLTEWDEFRWIEPRHVRQVMAGNAVVDARNLLDCAAWIREGFSYQGVGR
jgi:UDPglucose 6-dehydrogenase